MAGGSNDDTTITVGALTNMDGTLTSPAPAASPSRRKPASTEITTTGTDGDDIVTGSAIAENTMDGGGGNDDLTGGAADDDISGGEGDDTLEAGDGDDQVSGGAGDDTVVGGHGGGDDTYDGGADIDTVTYTSTTLGVAVDLAAGTASGPEIGSDTLIDIENVTGGAGGDDIAGDADANVLDGAGGDDRIEGRGGDDTLGGGEGSDSCGLFRPAQRLHHRGDRRSGRVPHHRQPRRLERRHRSRLRLRAVRVQRRHAGRSRHPQHRAGRRRRRPLRRRRRRPAQRRRGQWRARRRQRSRGQCADGGAGIGAVACAELHAQRRRLVQLPGRGRTSTARIRSPTAPSTAPLYSDEIAVQINVAPVNDAPTVANAIADQNATEDTPFAFTLPSNTFADVDLGDARTLTATLAGGERAAGLADRSTRRPARSPERRSTATSARSRCG